MKAYLSFLILFLISSQALALGHAISFNTASSASGGVTLIEYNYGFAGRRVIQDDDGHASLVAILSIAKNQYFEANAPGPNENFAGWSNGYQQAFRASAVKLYNFYNENGVCSHELPTISGICTQLQDLRVRLGRSNVTYGDLFALSDFIQSLPGMGLQHSYDVDRYDGDTLLPPGDKQAAQYMFSTDNLSVWMPDSPSLARCRDTHGASEGFLGQLANANSAGANIGDDGRGATGIQTDR